MSYSVKNHEDRILELERRVTELQNRKTSVYEERIIYQGPSNRIQDGGTITIQLSEPITNFRMLEFHFWTANVEWTYPVNKVRTLLVSRVVQGDLDFYVGGDGKANMIRGLVLNVSSDRRSLTIRSRDTYFIMHKVIGISL